MLSPYSSLNSFGRIKLLCAVLGLFLCIAVCAQAADPNSNQLDADGKAVQIELPPAADRPVDFIKDIAPILEQRCFVCHGPDEHEGQLRLDAKAIVLHGGISGPAILPGKSAESLLIKRIVGVQDASIGDLPQMPPDEVPLTAEEIGLVRAWIDQGAKWPAGFGADIKEIERHWAYKVPVKNPLPEVKNKDWVRNPLDHFVLAGLEKRGLEPSAELERAQLLRRLSLDLIGLPPTLEDLDAFLKDDSPVAYERAVDRLLSSPQYGERWARHWLDLVRYADSNGYQADQIRDSWPYRDWVIKAMNDDMPFDQFTLEQMAGDLLPESTLEQKIATGMHRATTCNVEAGVDPEENRVNQVIDRVNVTGTVWLGTTFECIQCHNHKYDPLTQRDYYGMFAFFNNTPLEVKHNGGVQFELAGPNLELPLSEEQKVQRAKLIADRSKDQKELKSLQQQMAKLTKQAKKPTIVEGTPPESAVESDAQAVGTSAKLLEQTKDQVKNLTANIADLNKKIKEIKPVQTPVMQEMSEPRETHVFQRGNFLTPAEQVQPHTPRILHSFPENLPRNRVGLSRWLVCRENPLVARVTVNRWWAQMFGRGLVETLEDFGTQGEPAVYPELLDWLAVEFADSGWSMKHMHKLMVMSAVYRQSSQLTPEALESDPDNRLLARGPRFRLPAETIRDNALAVSGLLSKKLGGPPVFPPQPDGIWRHVGRNAPKYIVSPGEDRFRRGMYVIWRRSAPYASFINFDAPDRAAACIKRPRTNTPLQALTLMNDPAYLEMARALGDRLLSELDTASNSKKIDYGFRLCVARHATEQEQAAMLTVFESQLARYQQDSAAARKLLHEEPIKKNAQPDQASLPTADEAQLAERAAWFFVASVLLNLDETITKP